MKNPFRQPSENEEDFDAMLSVSEHANQYAVVFEAAKAVAARYGVVPSPRFLHCSPLFSTVLLTKGGGAG